MSAISRFEDLEIWQLAGNQAKEIYLLGNNIAFSGDFSLRTQINAASGSVMDNIAKGFDRSGNKEFTNFLIIAKGSNAETRSQLYRAFDRDYITEDTFTSLNLENETLGNKLMEFIKYLKNSAFKGQRNI